VVLSLLLAASALPACGPQAVQARPVTISDVAGARASLGQVVSVAGIGRHTKAADSVEASGFSVYCLGAQLPDDRFDQPVTAHGRLELTDDLSATVGPSGEMSQGTEPGSLSYVLKDCTFLSQ
jgi:hypothetical protein